MEMSVICHQVRQFPLNPQESPSRNQILDHQREIKSWTISEKSNLGPSDLRAKEGTVS